MANVEAFQELEFDPRNYGYYGSWLHGYKMSPPEHYPIKDLDVFYQENKRAIVQTIAREVTELGPVKLRLSFYVQFKKEVDNATERMEHFFWNDPPLIVTHMHQLRDSSALDVIVNSNKEEISRWQNQGSDWVADRILTVYLEFSRYEPIRGGTFIPTPTKLRSKQAIINVKNRGDQCLRWALRAALFPAQVHVDRPGSYPVDDGLNFTGIDFPTPLHQISEIERLNNLAINAFGWRNNKTFIIRVSEVEDPNVRRINVMLLTDRNTTHYCYIKSLSRFLHSEYDAGRRINFCERCLQGFSSERVLNDHLFYCRGVKGRAVRAEMPKEGENALFFENYQNQMKKPWVIYADFKSIVEKIHGCFSDPGQNSTTKTSVHKPCGFCMVAVRSDGKTKGPYLYRGADVVQGFLHYLQLLEREIIGELRVKAPLNMTRADWADFNRARDCHICNKPLVKENQRDAIEVHDPDTGEYAGLVQRYKNKCYKKAYNMYIQNEEGQLEAFPFIGPRNKRQQPPEQVFEQEDCLFCGEPLVQRSFRDAVKDHCHITGEYRGAAHRACNINYFGN